MILSKREFNNLRYEKLDLAQAMEGEGKLL